MRLSGGPQRAVILDAVQGQEEDVGSAGRAELSHHRPISHLAVSSLEATSKTFLFEVESAELSLCWHSAQTVTPPSQ